MPLRPTKIIQTAAFEKAFIAKGDIERKAITRALRQMKNDVYYPSLRVHKLEGQGDIRGAHATDNQVISLTVVGSEVTLRACCNHRMSIGTPEPKRPARVKLRRSNEDGRTRWVRPYAQAGCAWRGLVMAR